MADLDRELHDQLSRMTREREDAAPEGPVEIPEDALEAIGEVEGSLDEPEEPETPPDPVVHEPKPAPAPIEIPAEVLREAAEAITEVEGSLEQPADPPPLEAHASRTPGPLPFDAPETERFAQDMETIAEVERSLPRSELDQGGSSGSKQIEVKHVLELVVSPSEDFAQQISDKARPLIEQMMADLQARVTDEISYAVSLVERGSSIP